MKTQWRTLHTFGPIRDGYSPIWPHLGHQPPTVTVFQRPNMCATTYHYTSVRSGFAVAGQRLRNSLPAELRQPDLFLRQFCQALNTHLFCWWLRRLLTFCFMAPCIKALTYILTYLPYHSIKT